ncbi:MAG: molecular chaperone DnaJ [Planctomycetota bacterium]|jgi:molecular chaperone DnaJ|nr:molecular chaperone DnaJ [Planctomycetota bacterium]
MPSKRCYYEVLSISKSADDGAIKASYRKLALEYHPDRNPGDEDVAVRFREVQEAFEVLRDPDKRKRYDRYGHAGMGESPGGGGGGGEDMMNAFGDLFGSIFGGAQQGRRQGGRDLRLDMAIDLAEAARGGSKTIEVTRKEGCRDCSGTGATPGTRVARCRTCNGQGVLLQGQGFFRIQRPCHACGGRGETIPDPCRTCRGSAQVDVRQNIEVKFPAGIEDGMRGRISGYGEAGPGGEPGDLYVFYQVLPHPFFQREGSDLHCEVPITFSQAALGGEIMVPTLLHGPNPIRLERGQQNGEKVRLPGKGLPNLQTKRSGDLVVHVRVETPRNLTPRQEELFRELAAIEDRDVSPQRKSFLDRVKDFFAGTPASDNQRSTDSSTSTGGRT